MNKLIVVGAGPHSEVVLDMLQQRNEYEIVGLTDAKRRGDVLGCPILGTDEVVLPSLLKQGVKYAVVALGDNKIRKKVFQKLLALGYELINVISPHAVLSRHVQLGRGIVIMPGAVVNVGTTIGDASIINTNASVDHDCLIGNFVHIAPGCAISGSTTIGNETFIGTGSRIIDNIHIGNNVIVGAGSVVIRDLEDDCEAVGVPSKVIKRF